MTNQLSQQPLNAVAVILLISLLGLSNAPLMAQAQTDNQVVAVVNDRAITFYDILSSLKKGSVDYYALPQKDRDQVFRERLHSRIVTILQEDAARRAGVSITEEEFQTYLNREKDQYADSGGFDAFLVDQGMTVQEFEADFRKEQETMAWLNVVSGVGGSRLSRELRPRFDLSVTPKEMRRFYKEHLKSDFTLKNEALVEVIQVYFTTGRNGNKNAKLSRMRSIKNKLKTGSDFKVLAQRNSDHSSKAKGGTLPAIEMGNTDLVPEAVEKAIFAEKVKVGDVLGPITNVNSLWLVKVVNRRKARVIPFSEAQLIIRNLIQRKKRARAIRKMQIRLLDESYISPPKLKREIVGILRASKS